MHHHSIDKQHSSSFYIGEQFSIYIAYEEIAEKMNTLREFYFREILETRQSEDRDSTETQSTAVGSMTIIIS